MKDKNKKQNWKVPSKKEVWKEFAKLKSAELGWTVGIGLCGYVFTIGLEKLGKLTWNIFNGNRDCVAYEIGKKAVESTQEFAPLNAYCNFGDAWFIGLLAFICIGLIGFILFHFLRWNWRKASVKAWENANPRYVLRNGYFDGSSYENLKYLQEGKKTFKECTRRKVR